MKIKKSVCIIGSGKAAYQHYRCLKNLVSKKIYILTRKIKNNKKLKKFESPQTVFIDNYKSIASNVDSIVVATPWYVNDRYVKFFKNETKPILFEKPIGVKTNSFYYLKKKDNKFVGLNRRQFVTTQFLKKHIKKNKIVEVTVNICENLGKFVKRFKKKENYIFYESSIHSIDLILYLFGVPLKIKKLKSFIKNKNKTGFYIFYYRDFLIKINFLNTNSETNSFFIRFKNKSLVHLSSNNILKFYQKTKVQKLNGNSLHFSQKKFEIKEKDSRYKYGFYQQAKLFLENKLDSTLNSYTNTHKIIKKLT